MSLLRLAVVCPTYGTRSQEFCCAEPENWWGKEGEICSERVQTCAH